MRKLRLEKVAPGAVLARPVLNPFGMVIVPQGTELTPGFIQRLREAGITHVYVEDPIFRGIEPKEPVPSSVKGKVMSLFRRVKQEQLTNSHELYDETFALVKEIEEHLFSGDTSSVNIVDLVSPEEYLVVHSLNVTVLSMIMAYHNGFPNRITEVGMGALLHDLGMLFIDQAILQKDGPLNDEERAQVRSHVDRSLKIIGASPSWNAFSKVFILQHHERCDGSGYPRGLLCKDIHPVGRIAAIADVYSSLVYPRSFRQGMMPHQAMEMIMGMAGFELDYHLVESFCQLLVPYPVGTLVRLDDGTTAVVAAINKNVKTRPVLRLLTGPDGVAMKEVVELDLADPKNQTIIIAGVVPED